MFPDRRIMLLFLAAATLAAETKAERTDCYGDLLPHGAIARMGTVRGRLPGLVQACAFSRDGKIIVAAGGDAAIHLFDAETLRPLRQLREHKADVTCLAFSPDGKMLASGSKDGTLCFWELPSGKVLRRFPAHKEGVRSLAFAGTGKFLASGGEDTLVRLWDPATGRELRQYKGHKTLVTAIAVSPDGRLVASGDQSPFVSMRLWEADSGRLLKQQKLRGDWIRSLAISPDGKMVALPVDITKVGLWDVASGKIVREFERKVGGVSPSAVAFSPDGRSVAAVGEDKGLFLWESATGKILHQLPVSYYIRSPGGMMCLAFSPDGGRLAFGEDHCLRVWDLSNWREVLPVEGHADHINRVLFSRDNKSLATATGEPADALPEWDAATGKKRRTLWRKHLMGKHGFQLSPDHTVLTLVNYEQNNLLVRSRNTITGKEIRCRKLPFKVDGGYHPAMIVLSPDEKIITSEYPENGNSRNLGVLLRETTTGKELSTLPGSYNSLSFSPDSRILACVEDKHIDLYKVPRGRINGELPIDGVGHSPKSLAFSRDSRLVAVFSSLSAHSSPYSPDDSAGRLALWETATGRKRAVWRISDSCFVSLAFSPDGAVLAAGDSQGIIHFWNLATGKQIRELPGHRGAIVCLTFSHDGKRLASGSSDTTALIWDLRETAEAVRPLAADVSRERLEQLWKDLGDNDGGRVHRAIWELVAARPVMPWLREHLKPAAPPDVPRIARRIADLDSDRFAVREKATRELEEMGEAAEPALRKVLAGKPTLELRRRVEPIVNRLEEWPASSPTALRAWRALEVLEHLGTPEARQLLRKLADGAPEARLTREAKAALGRLDARSITMP